MRQVEGKRLALGRSRAVVDTPVEGDRAAGDNPEAGSRERRAVGSHQEGEGKTSALERSNGATASAQKLSDRF